MTKPAAKKSSSKGNQDDEVVLEFINKNNRPYSAQMVENAHPSLGKTKVVKILKYLAEQGKITSKESGKNSVIYWKMQEEDELDEYGQPIGGPKPTIDDLNRSIASLTSTNNDLADELKKLQSQTKQLEAQMTDAQIKEEIDRLTKESNDMQVKINGYKAKNISVSANEKKKLEADHAKARREWLKRKNLFKEILAEILERSSKKKKDLQEEVGWEADEDLKIEMIPDRTQKVVDRTVQDFKRQKR
eukprot:gene12172-14247_t